MSTGARRVATSVTCTLRSGAAVLAILLVIAVAPGAEGGNEMLAVGEPFTDFDLPAHDGGTVSSTDLGGRPYLLFYYPKADTPG